MSVRTALKAAVVPFLLMLPALAMSPENPTVIKFAAGGEVRLNLSAGAIVIEPTDADEISIRWTTKNPDDMNKVQIKQQIISNEAEIEVDSPRGFQATILLPRKSDLRIRMSAGDLEIGEFSGDKDVRLRAGDLKIKSGNKDVYALVDASVTSGGLDAPAFDVSKGGLWRSFKHKGSGIHALRAHVSAGQLTIE
jgi:hypothetical protein